MKKRILLLLLAAFMAFSLIACNQSAVEGPTDGPTTEPTEAPTEPPLVAVEPELVQDVYQLKDIRHVLYMAEHPDKNYALVADIDMEGYRWTPVDDFSGSLTGLIYGAFNYTISNVVIEEEGSDANVGFFRTISGTVQEINFENITVTVTGTSTGDLGVLAGSCATALKDVDVLDSTLTATVKDANVGVLAGTVASTVNGCYTTGNLNVTLAGDNCYVGGGVACAEAMVSNLESRVNVTVTATAAASGATGGVVGKAAALVQSANYGGNFKVSADATHVAGTLVGQLQDTLYKSYSCARSVEVTGAASQHLHYGSALAGLTIQSYTRDTSNLEENMSAEEYAMRKKVVDYMYEMCTMRWTPSEELIFQCFHTQNNGHYQKYVPGEIYFGQPYTHGNGYAERMESCMTSDGTIVSDLDLKKWHGYLGNDCNDAVMWAWSMVSDKANATYTGDCVRTYGIEPVGDYKFTGSTETSDICAQNGAQKIYEAYAQAKMGNAIVWAVGHIRLVAENAYVVRKADGSIDPMNSYILTHEQGMNTNQLEQTHTTCLVYGRYTFYQLFNTNYIPITIDTYAKGKADEIKITTTNTDLTKDGVGKGNLQSNYRLKWVQIKVTDASGKVVLEALNNMPVANGASGSNEVDHHAYFSLTSQFKDAVANMKLEAGKQYTYEVRVLVSDQEVVVQEYSFTA